jgi:hypothetical protein
MNAIAKRLAMLPINLLQHVGGALRVHLVHLTIAFVVGSCWIVGWSRSFDPVPPRFLFPALRKEDVARYVRERSGRAVPVRTPQASSNVATVPLENEK